MEKKKCPKCGTVMDSDYAVSFGSPNAVRYWECPCCKYAVDENGEEMGD